MGLFKILLLTVGPASYLVYSTFRLGPKLPIACRQFGNSIGLGYVYFKVLIKTLKPQNQMGVEIVDIVRKMSQQSKALKREINSQFRKVSQDARKEFGIDQGFSELVSAASDQEKTANPLQNKALTGTRLMHSIDVERRRIDMNKKAKKESNKFFTEI